MKRVNLSGSSEMPEESKTMRFLRRVGSDRLAWSLRRLHCPVSSEALVLEVGSGGNPYPRANVLLDAYEDTRERHWVPLVTDRPFVFGYIEQLPFKTDSFDFLIASHVLEHSRDPEQTLTEFQRVAKAGYIEVPDAFMERVNPYKDHRLELTVRNDQLLMRYKFDWIIDKELVELYEYRVKAVLTRDLIPSRPFHFMVRYYWRRPINYQILNRGVDIQWPPPTSNVVRSGTSRATRVRERLVAILRNVTSQRKRNRRIDVFSLLCCPTCKSETDLQRSVDSVTCTACGCNYPVRSGIPVMYPR